MILLEVRKRMINGEKKIPRSQKIKIDSALKMEDISLPPNMTFNEYKERIDELAPFGRDQKDIAHLIPMEGNEDQPAWREEMKYRSDWGGFRRTGIGWKLNPTMFIALALFLPVMVGLPVLYLIFASFEYFIQDLIQEFVLYAPFLLLIAILTKLIAYCEIRIDELIKPYGKDHESIKMLFKDDLEYLKFSKSLVNKTMSFKWIYLGIIGFLLITPIGLTSVFSIEQWRAGLLAPIPDWCRFLLIFSSIGLGAIGFLLCTFVIAIGYGLFQMGRLGNDPENLSIHAFSKMLDQINAMMSRVQLNHVTLRKIKKELDVTGKTYFEFQRGNRKIGEFLFNVAAILIFMCVIMGIILWIINLFNLLPAFFGTSLNLVSIILTCFGIFSLLIFILPQLHLHKLLKEFKYNLIDSFSSLASRLEFIYFESIVNPEILTMFTKGWKRRKHVMNDVYLIKDMIDEVKSYGTWSYDFPEIMKLILVAASTLIPFLLSFLQL